jgi:hypothetical protein
MSDDPHADRRTAFDRVADVVEAHVDMSRVAALALDALAGDPVWFRFCGIIETAHRDRCPRNKKSREVREPMTG